MSRNQMASRRLLALLLPMLALTCGSPAPVSTPVAAVSMEAPTPEPLAVLPRDATWGLQIAEASDHQAYVPHHTAQPLDAATTKQLLKHAVPAKTASLADHSPRSPKAARTAPQPSLRVNDRSKLGTSRATISPSHDASPLAPRPPNPASPLVAFGPFGSDNRGDAFVSLTFEAPVVPLELIGAALAQPPFRITPEVPGTWRWLDTSLLAFQPTTALPMATRFMVTYAGETTPHPTWSAPHAFETAALDVVEWFPSDGTGDVNTTSTVLLHLNQRVHAENLVPFVSIEANGKPIEARLTRRQASSETTTTYSAPDPEAWLRLRSKTPLPEGANVRVVLKSGAPSAEGPKTLTAPRELTFTTAIPDCPPGQACKREADKSRGYGSASILGGAPRFEKKLRVDGEETRVLVADRPPVLNFETQGVAQAKAAVYRVNVGDFPKFREFREREQTGRRNGTPLEEIPPGEFLEMRHFDAHVTPEWTPHALDLRSYLQQGLGHLVIQVNTGTLRETRWIQVTNLGLLRQGRTTEAHVFAFDLNSRQPLSGVTLNVLGRAPSATTDADGIATLALGTASGYQVLVARRGQDVTFESFWAVAPAPPSLHWRLTDRQSHFAPSGKLVLSGDVGPAPLAHHYGPGAYSITYRVQPRFFRLTRQALYLQGSAPVDADGKFELEFRLPDVEARSCTLELELRRDGELIDEVHERDLPIHLAELPYPKLAVAATSSQVTTGDQLEVTARVAAPSGASLAGETIYWQAVASRSRINPPGYVDFAFGPEELRVNDAKGSTHIDDENGGDSVYLQGNTDARGEHRLQVSLSGAGAFPRSVTLMASTEPWRDESGRVSSASRDVVDARTVVFVAPGSAAVGLRPTRGFVLAGESMDVDIVVTDYRGTPLLDRDVVVQAGRRVFEDGTPFVPTAECRLRSKATAQRCRLPTTRAGNHRIVARVADQQGRYSDTETSVFVAGEEQLPAIDGLLSVVEPASADVHQPRRLLVMTPHVPATGWLSVMKTDEVTLRRRVDITSPISVLTLPGLAESTRADLLLVGAASVAESRSYEPSAQGLPVSMYGAIPLPLGAPKNREAIVTLRQAPESSPGQWSLLAEVTEHGKPVSGRSVQIDLRPNRCAPQMHPRRIGSMLHKVAHTFQTTTEGTSRYVLRPKLPSSTDGAAPRHESESDRQRNEIIQHLYSRVDDDDGALPSRMNRDRDSVAPPLPAPPAMQTTGASGRVVFHLPAPIPAGQYCATAFVDGEESHVHSEPLSLVVPEATRAGLLPPLSSLRAPGRLTAGDAAELTAVVQNPDVLPRTVRLALAVSGATLDGNPGYELTLGPGESAELPFLVRAGLVGEATFRLVVASAPSPVPSPSTQAPLDFSVAPVVETSLRVEAPTQPASSPARNEKAAEATRPSDAPVAPIDVSRYYESATAVGSTAAASDGSVHLSHGESLSYVLVIRVRHSVKGVQLLDRLPPGLTLEASPLRKGSPRTISAEIRSSSLAATERSRASTPVLRVMLQDNDTVSATATVLEPGVYLVRYPVRTAFKGAVSGIATPRNGQAPRCKHERREPGRSRMDRNRVTRSGNMWWE